MYEIADFLAKVELHDSCLQALMMKGDGILEMEIDFDEIWNPNIGDDVHGLVLHSVYEISNFKLDRLNVIGSVSLECVENYDKSFVTHDSCSSNKVVALLIDFVAGGMMRIIFSGSCEYLRSPNKSSHSAS